MRLLHHDMLIVKLVAYEFDETVLKLVQVHQIDSLSTNRLKF